MESGQYQQLHGMLSIVLTTAGRLEEGLVIDRPPGYKLEDLRRQLSLTIKGLDDCRQKLDCLLEQNEQILKKLGRP